MADVTKTGNRMVVLCPKCHYRIIKRIIRRRAGG